MSPTVKTILPPNLVNVRLVVPYQIVTSLIAWIRFLPSSHVATKWICPQTVIFLGIIGYKCYASLMYNKKLEVALIILNGRRNKKATRAKKERWRIR